MSEPTLVVMGGRRGRPPRAGARATRRIQVWLTEDEAGELAQVAKQERKDLAALVRDAVNEYVSDYGDREVFRGNSRRQ